MQIDTRRNARWLLRPTRTESYAASGISQFTTHSVRAEPVEAIRQASALVGAIVIAPNENIHNSSLAHEQ